MNNLNHNSWIKFANWPTTIFIGFCKGCVNPTLTYRCRDLALKTYHSYECGIAAFLDVSGLGPVPLLALRTVARFGETDYVFHVTL